MVSFIILAIFIVTYIKCFSKAFIALIALYPLLGQFAVPGVPINLFHSLSLIAFVFYIFKYGINYKILKSCPAALPLLLLCFSYYISNYYASTKHYPTLALNVIQIFNIFIFYSIIKKSPQQYIPYFIRICYVFGGIIAIYTLFESVTRTNPYIQFVNYMDIYSQKFYITEVRFGIKRCQALFSMHSTLGAVAITIACMLLYVKQNTRLLLSYKRMALIIALLFCAVFFSGTRSAIIGCACCALMFWNKKFLKLKHFILICLLALIVFVFVGGYIESIVESITDTEKVSGSNTAMRERQFEIAQLFMAQSLWFGNGLAYTFEYVQANYEEIAGAESLWLSIMIDLGAFGLFAYFTIILSFSIYVLKNSPRLIFFLLGILIYNTMSSIPNYNFLYLVIYLQVMIEAKKYFPKKLR